MSRPRVQWCDMHAHLIRCGLAGVSHVAVAVVATVAVAAVVGLVAVTGCASEGSNATTTAGSAASSAGSAATEVPASLQPLFDSLPLIYLNLAAEVSPGAVAPLSSDAIAELGIVLPKVKADCESGKAQDWPATRAKLIDICTGLGATLGMPTPTASKNLGVLLPPDSRVTWSFRALPSHDARTSSSEAAYRVEVGGNVALELGERKVVFPVSSGTIAIDGFEDTNAGERVSTPTRASFILTTPEGAAIEIALAANSPSRAVFVKPDRTGLLTAAFTIKSTDPLMQRYFDLFGTVRLTMDFVLRDGALDFAAAGPMPALVVAPSELPLVPGTDACAGLPEPNLAASGEAPAINAPSAARPLRSAWTNAQLEIVREYCRMREQLRQTPSPG